MVLILILSIKNTKILAKNIFRNNKSHQLVFVLNSSEHKARTVLIQFSGENAAHLYNLLKSGEFYWSDFDHFDLVLGRFDINYIREKQVIDDLVFQDFGERCVQKYKAHYLKP